MRPAASWAIANTRERPMRARKPSRRDVLKAVSGLVAGSVFAQPLKAAARDASAVTPALIAAARKEGKIAFYTALELPTAERLGKLFEARYPGVAVRVERSGAERIFPHRAGADKPRLRGRRGLHHRRRAFHRLEAR